MIKCKICSKEYSDKNMGGIGAHLKYSHGLSLNEYAEKFYDAEGEKSNNYKTDHKNCVIKYLDNKDYKCPICDKSLTENSSYIESHIKRTHKITDYYNDFYLKYYTFKNKKQYYEFLEKGELCGLCSTRKINTNSMIIPDHKNKTFCMDIENGYVCGTDECKNETSLKLLGTQYNKKTYEHIGSRLDYLMLKYKSEDESYIKENFKTGFIDYSKPVTCSLKDYCVRYGKEEGTKLYNERNIKIGKANTLDWYIEKYGEKEGSRKFSLKRDRTKQQTLGTTTSKISSKLELLLEDIGIDFYTEYFYNKNLHAKRTDFYIPGHNTHIEFFGDYWHANPKFWEKDKIHNTLKKTAKEIWEKDAVRLNEITSINNANVIVIWEHTFKTIYDHNTLSKIIKGFLNGKHEGKILRL